VNLSPPVRRRVFVIAVGAAVVLLVGYGFLPKAVIVDVAAASRGALRVSIEEEGRTRVKDRFVVSAPVPGFLRRITLNAGDQVRKSERVAALEPLGSTVLYPRSRARRRPVSPGGLCREKEGARGNSGRRVRL
jgi:HlyD family secretion protein